jgi:hypothetical protein
MLIGILHGPLAECWSLSGTDILFAGLFSPSQRQTLATE